MNPAETALRVVLDPPPSLDGPCSPQTGFDILFEATPTPIVVLDRETLYFRRVNNAALAFYGYSCEEFLRLRLPDIRPEKVPGEIEGMIARFDDPTLPDTPRFHRTKAGQWRIVKVNARIIDFEGRAAILAAIFDMTAEHELQREIRATKSFLRNMIESVPTAMFAKEAATGEFVLYNSAAERLFGVPREQIVGRTTREVFGEKDVQKFLQQDSLTLAAGTEGISVDTIIHHPELGDRCIRMKKVAVGDGEADGRRYILAAAEDVTEERVREAEIAHLASHDSLTGLANRWLFQQRLAEARQHHAERAGGIAVHYIDLDGFKEVNDTWGHGVGDRILLAAAQRMRQVVRKGDIVARLGGDEFAVLQSIIPGPGAARALARRLVARLSEPYADDGRTCSIGASIGICLVRPGMTAERIIEEADRALYAAKREGKGRFIVGSGTERPDLRGVTPRIVSPGPATRPLR
jgi:diguanylate cyclase (GGDEF)-like protein/PAS domain S-box-containing protein